MQVRELRERCAKIRRHLLHYRLATEEEVGTYWPEEPEWPVTGVTPASYLESEPQGEHAPLARQLTDQDPWIICLMQMGRLFGRQEWMKEGSDYASEQLLKALRDEPEEVQLTSGEVLRVYPKSFDVLEWASWHGWTIGWVEARRAALERALAEDEEIDPEQVPTPASTLEAATRETVEQHALLCWVATSEGAGFPWAGNGGDRWQPTEATPERFYELHPLDVRFIVEGFRRVNFLRLHWLPQLKPRKGDGDGSGWEAFWANRAKRTGKPSRFLMMAESFASQLAEETLAVHTLEEVLGD